MNMIHPKAFLSKQLARPSGALARWFLGRLWNRRNSALNDAAFSLLAPVLPARILEVGFGGGYLLHRILTASGQSKSAGIDHSPEMVRLCQKQFSQPIQSGQLALALASAEAIPWATRSFDCLVSVNSIFYWSDPIRAVSEFARVLTPGGRLVLVYTCSEDIQNRPFDSRALHLNKPDQLAAWLAAAGFTQANTQLAQDRYRRFWCLQATRGEVDK
jgi:arsenite methyltransferase